MNTKEVLFALSKKYEHESYAFFPEVRNGTGFGVEVRTADAIVMGLWPSRGVELEGFEIKVSRQDWLNEIKKPSKSNAIAKYCDRWWLVVGDEEIVKDGEIPSQWGLMVPNKKGGLKVKKAAEKIEAVPITRLFLASLMRKTEQIQVPKSAEKEIEDRLLKEIKEKLDREATWKRKDELRNIEVYEAFENALGEKITDMWIERAKERAELFKRVCKGDFDNYKEMMIRLRNDAKRIFDKLDEEIRG